MAYFAPHIALATLSKKVILFHLNKKEIEHIYEGHADYVRSVDFSLDGTLLASASDDTTVKIWGREAHSLKKTLSNIKEKVRAVRFSKNQLACSSKDMCIYLYDLQNFELNVVLKGHTTDIWSLAFGDG